ncbi:MAG: diguanylate cyclase [Actinobacteria bacterium]|nr:diguanylate cyclase [Actinomycetota bacterium]
MHDTGYGEREVYNPRRREFLFRILFALSFLAVVQLHHFNIDLGGEIDFTSLYILIGAYFIYALVLLLFHATFSLNGPLGWAVACVDVFSLCAAIFFCGGVESYLFLSFGILPLIGGIFGDYKGALYTGLLCLIGFTGIVIFDAQQSATYNYAQGIALRYAFIIGATVLGVFIIDLVLKDRNRLKIFYEISQSSSKSPALYNVLKEITQRMAEILKAEVALVFLHNEEAETLEAQQPSLGLDFISTSRLRLDAAAPGVLSNCFRNVKPVLVSRRLSREVEVLPFAPDYNVFDLIACPLVARGKSIGLIVLANKLNRWGFNRRDLTLTELLAPHISVFLDNALLYRGSEEKVAQLTSLIRVVDAINTVSNLNQLYNLALDVIRGLFAVEKALINIIDSKTGLMETVRSFGYSEEYTDRHLTQPFESVNECFVLSHDRTFLSMDVTKDARCPNMLVDPETTSVLCVPIRSGKKIYGIMHMASRYQNAFDEEDATLANAICEQIGMAVESAQLFEEVSRLAITDELTGLYNIRHLKRVLGEEVKRSVRYNRPLSFFMLDIDWFKIYNDQHGHPRGDEILRILSGLLQQNTRDVDTVFRYGGEEFSVIIPEVSKDEAYAMAERIRRVIQEYVFPYEEDQPGGNLTVSIGVANLPDDADEGDELVENADRALYRAKHSGRNRACMFNPSEDGRGAQPRRPTSN